MNDSNDIKDIKEPKEKKQKKEGLTFGKAMGAPFVFFINKGKKMSLTKLIVTSVIMLIIPYALVWLFGLLDLFLLDVVYAFDLAQALMYVYLPVVFVLLVINITMAVLMIVGYAKKGRKGK